MIEPLNIQYLFVNVFAGSMIIFLVMLVAVLAALAARFKMNGYTFGLLMLLFGAIMQMYADWIIVLEVLIGGLVAFFIFAKIASR
jgi:hypothetical protein